LDKNLRRLADVIVAQLHIDVADVPGSGAAGGLGAGLIAFCGAKLGRGIETVLNTIDFERYLQGADLVITGEGRIDGQSVYGKVPVGVAARAKKYHLPVLAIVGDIGEGAEAVYDYGIDGIMSTVNRAVPLEEAIAHSQKMLEDAAERVMRFFKIGMALKK
jgi:glycerate kinase